MKAHRDVWRRVFTPNAQNLLDVRSEIASALVTSLQVSIGDDLKARLSPTALTHNPDAYRKYLRGRYLLRWRRPETMLTAAQELQDAISLDPAFTQAYGALAAVYALWAPGWPPPDGSPRSLALHYAHQALKLDPQTAEALAVLGNDHSMLGHYSDAEALFRRAIAADPRDPSLLHFYAVHLYSVGKLDEALSIERRSVALEPKSAQPMMWLAMLTTLRGDRNEALRLWRETDELGAARPLAATIVRLELNQPQYFRAWFNDESERTGLPDTVLAREELLVEGVLDRGKGRLPSALLRQHEREVTRALAITLYAMLGEVDDAYRLASHFDLVDDTDYAYQLATLWSPRTAALRADPRYGQLATRWGLAAYWRQYGPPDLCAVTDTEIHCH